MQYGNFIRTLTVGAALVSATEIQASGTPSNSCPDGCSSYDACKFTQSSPDDGHPQGSLNFYQANDNTMWVACEKIACSEPNCADLLKQYSKK